MSILFSNSRLSKATSDDLNPTPGYLLDEIAGTRLPRGVVQLGRRAHRSWPASAGMTHGSIEECDKVANFLVKRLTKRSPLVKIKVLRTIKVRRGRRQAGAEARQMILLAARCSTWRSMAERTSSTACSATHRRSRITCVRGMGARWRAAREGAQR